MTAQPPHVQTAMARAELKALQGQQAIAEYGIELLSGTAADLAEAVNNGEQETFTTKTILSGIVALVSIRLAELQTAHSANAERIAQLEGFLKQAESRVVVPNLQV